MKLHFKEETTVTTEETVIEDGQLVTKESSVVYRLGEIVTAIEVANRGDLSDIYFSDTAVAYDIPSSSFEILPDQPAPPVPKKCCGRS